MVEWEAKKPSDVLINYYFYSFIEATFVGMKHYQLSLAPCLNHFRADKALSNYLPSVLENEIWQHRHSANFGTLQTL